ASVAGAFPSGQSPLRLRLEEVKYAVSEGADEIDMVISRGKFLENDFQFIFEEVALTKHACGNAHLKVILETGELQSLKNILIASSLAIAAGADFIKTSTGKMGIGATLPAVFVMMQAVKDHFDITGKRIGIKPSGGVAECDQALDYLCLLQTVLGDAWLTPDLFRFGASRLADRINEELN
ncbi:MAG: deoxyribose-phosphate aldolase, partial [Bacteroidota bacterium]